MSNDQLLSRISSDPNICFGKPCVRGHRIWVSLILDLLASGETMDDVLEAYPSIEREDVLACIAYGAEMARGGWIEIPLGRDKEIA
ncbi:MAG: DUF433 domain-containing protein [Kaiparowitsia implicata GSE-PSE-MK54-09C]|jgi:uncharacterized protein (DUF433 family)|nr:DUF433 domain-containing protein [Kaiparowitsia implicata GSE-PSE-MK54-09C]